MENNTNEIITWEAPQLIETTFEETESGFSANVYEDTIFHS